MDEKGGSCNNSSKDSEPLPSCILGFTFDPPMLSSMHSPLKKSFCMTIKSSFAILLASILFRHCGVAAGNIKSIQWEYQVLSLDDLTRLAVGDGALSDSPKPTLESLPILLNLQGKSGWKICGIISDRSVFKRKRQVEHLLRRAS